MSDLLYTNGPVPYREDLFQAFREAGVEARFDVPLVDLRSEWERERPDRVFVPEFSAIALTALRSRKRFGFKVISLCDDSMDMISGQIRPTEKPIIAFVGRFVGLKNIPALLRAFEPLRNRAQLVLIGDGPERPVLESMAPHALFTGFLSGDERLAWYNLIDILVLPSTQEAYGAVTGEALMAGAKVVVSRQAGSSDLVREGENGCLFDPVDEKGLTACMEKLLETLHPGRPVALRENLLPYRFETCIQDLLKEINLL